MSTSIEWTDETWNPIKGCSRVSPGCDNCYAISMAHRFSWGDGLTRIRKADGKVDWTGVTRYYPGELGQPGRWKRPRRVFVCSGADLFHPSVAFADIAEIFAVMGWVERHTFQVLTKRPDLAFAFLKRYGRIHPNVWIGVSVEDQQRADERLPVLAQCPAALRFASFEPLIGPVDLDAVPHERGWRGLDWAIIGGESGPGARPFDLAWCRKLLEQLEDVPTFVKQLGRDPFEDLQRLRLSNRKGNIPTEWPEDLRVQEFPA